MFDWLPEMLSAFYWWRKIVENESEKAKEGTDEKKTLIEGQISTLSTRLDLYLAKIKVPV
jgi:hypothetical protein